ncbi:hypothetical protein H8E88_01840 [candidate division KSB1 bacterium]|nr:hypothetical protein [candidate division KSB1 bacterium]
MINIIKKYESIIADYKIINWEIEPTSYRFKANMIFTNGTTLFVKDYLFSHKRKYSFHWQDENENLILRWDNAEHWKDIETFPFHKHEENKVLSSTETSLEDVLEYISHKIRQK